jgi:flagellar hook-associated protein 2
VEVTVSPTSPNTTFTLAELASAINDSDAGVSASLIKTGTDVYRLQLTASATGTDNDFTVSGIDGLGSTDSTIATNATIHYGGSSLSAFNVTSSTNTFTNVFPGVTFTTSAVEDDVTLTIADDISAMSSQVQALVTAINSSVASLQSATTYNATDKTAGLLMGDSSVRSIATSLPQAFLSAIAPLSTDLGLSVDKYGVISFNATTFAAAMTSDASGTKAAIIDWAQQIGQVTNDATAVATGTLSLAISSSESEIESVNTKIADWDQKLKDRTTLLTQIYSTINANLATLKTTSDWISDQITALTTKTN